MGIQLLDQPDDDFLTCNAGILPSWFPAACGGDCHENVIKLALDGNRAERIRFLILSAKIYHDDKDVKKFTIAFLELFPGRRKCAGRGNRPRLQPHPDRAGARRSAAVIR
jgi:hypothetical protein